LQNLGGIDDAAVTRKNGGFIETASLRYGQLSSLSWTTSGVGDSRQRFKPIVSPFLDGERRGRQSYESIFMGPAWF